MISDAVEVLQLSDADGLTLTLMDWGATWLSCRVPLRDGAPREVILGGPSPAAQRHGGGFLGATVGRYANRIAGARLQRGGQVWPLQAQPGSRHTLHGGPLGLHAQRWQIAERSAAAVCFTLDSPAGDQGFPGRLQARVGYRLAGGGVIEMHAEAEVDAACPVALTNHSYFNLDGHAGDARAHRLQLAAAAFVPVDAELIPLGAPAAVDGTGFDFRAPQTIASRWLADGQQRQAGGYDHAYLLDLACAGGRHAAAVLESADGRLALHLHTSLPALQLYTGQHLHQVPGRDGRPLAACAGIALEPGFLPDSPNHPEWPQPDCWLQPGQLYRHVIRYHLAEPLR